MTATGEVDGVWQKKDSCHLSMFMEVWSTRSYATDAVANTSQPNPDGCWQLPVTSIHRTCQFNSLNLSLQFSQPVTSIQCLNSLTAEKNSILTSKDTLSSHVENNLAEPISTNTRSTFSTVERSLWTTIGELLFSLPSSVWFEKRRIVNLFSATLAQIHCAEETFLCSADDTKRLKPEWNEYNVVRKAAD